MTPAMEDGRSTPRYALVFLVGVAVGSVVRVVGWVLPARLLNRISERLLP